MIPLSFVSNVCTGGLRATDRIAPATRASRVVPPQSAGCARAGNHCNAPGRSGVSRFAAADAPPFRVARWRSRRAATAVGFRLSALSPTRLRQGFADGGTPPANSSTIRRRTGSAIASEGCTPKLCAHGSPARPALALCGRDARRAVVKDQARRRPQHSTEKKKQRRKAKKKKKRLPQTLLRSALG